MAYRELLAVLRLLQVPVCLILLGGCAKHEVAPAVKIGRTLPVEPVAKLVAVTDARRAWDVDGKVIAKAQSKPFLLVSRRGAIYGPTNADVVSSGPSIRDGRRRRAVGAMSGPDTSEFAFDIPRDKIAKFELMNREVHRADFPTVALQPNVPTAATATAGAPSVLSG